MKVSIALIVLSFCAFGAFRNDTSTVIKPIVTQVTTYDTFKVVKILKDTMVIVKIDTIKGSSKKETAKKIK
jgi:hypothetical protein